MNQNKIGVPEMLLHCSKCDQSSHPTCIGLSLDLIHVRISILSSHPHCLMLETAQSTHYLGLWDEILCLYGIRMAYYRHSYAIKTQ